MPVDVDENVGCRPTATLHNVGVRQSIGDKDEENGLVVTIDAEDFDNFKESMMLVRSQINKRIRQKRSLNRALEREFKE